MLGPNVVFSIATRTAASASKLRAAAVMFELDFHGPIILSLMIMAALCFLA